MEIKTFIDYRLDDFYNHFILPNGFGFGMSSIHFIIINIISIIMINPTFFWIDRMAFDYAISDSL